MSACDHFTQNAWRPDLCSTCQRAKSEHDGAPGSRSWRRKSEPNPNNAITGVRISALASKFQGRDIRSGSTPDTEAERAKTLDRKITRNKEKKINTSRSTELLDATVSSSSLSSSTSASTSAIFGSNHSTQLSSETPRAKTEGLRSKHLTFVTGTLSQQPSTSPAKSSSLSAHTSVVAAAANSDKSTPPPTATLKPRFASSVINSSQSKVHATAVSSSGSKNSSRSLTSSSAVTSGSSLTSASSSASTKSNPTWQSVNESAKKLYVTQPSLKPSASSSSSALKSQPTNAVKETQASKEKQFKSKEKRRVSIPDLEPEVIGHDGGLDNLFPEEEVVVGGDNDHIYFSLTDEEKQFALLALGNTVWNSDTRNLQVEAEVAKRSCREFEDLTVDELWSKERFKSLVNCDPIKKQQVFGTFPQKSTSKQPRVTVEKFSFTPECRKADGVRKEDNTKSGCMADDEGDVNERRSRNSHSKGQGQTSAEGLRFSSSGNSVMNSLSSNSGRSSSSADSGIEMGSARAADPKEPLLSYTLADITDSLYKSPDDSGVAKNAVDLRVESIGCSTQDPLPGKSQSTNPEKSHDSAQSHHMISKQASLLSSQCTSLDENDPDKMNVSITDSTVQEGFQAVALLNDILKDYGDFNESSTDDFGIKDAKKEALKGKKSSEFEAKMASVAATLDLTKQQQRGRRQAPRPPVSPPPEPNLSEAVSPKKVVNQPDPIFKMVTVGKSIVTLPPQQDMPPKNSKPAIISYGLEDFGSFFEATDNVNNRTNGDGKTKKGITSFLRNILKRGRDSSESFDSMNPDVQLNVKMERKNSLGAVGSIDLPDDDMTSSSVDQKGGPKISPQVKLLAKPLTSPPQKQGDGNGTAPSGASDSGSDCLLNSELDRTATSASSAGAVTSESCVKASPPTQRKTSKGLSSPKMMLKKATAKFSPPTSRHVIKTQEKEQEISASSSTKPYPATTKPAVPSLTKPPTTSVPDPQPSATSTVVKEVGPTAADKESTSVPNVVRRRPKSPKRTAPPVPPTRTSVSTGKAISSESRNVDLAKELEWKLKKSTTEQSGGGTLSRSELRESTRRSMPVPPSPPGERKEKPYTTGTVSGSPPVSPIRETLNSLPSSPSSSTGASFDFTNTEWSGGSTSTIDDELPKFSEKIELPTVATQGRKGFLGKLGGNRKTRAPQPPSVKRAKSITQSSTLPRRDKKSKKINVADISGPVMVTDITNTKVLENRRNTISLGDEPAFISLSVSNLHPGGTSSSASVDKSGFDEFDCPVLSPLGSLENLYESILPKPEGILFNFYDPPTSPKVLCPNIPADGYLEPVPPLSSTAAATATSASSSPSSQLTGLSVSVTAATNLSSSSSTSSASSGTTNASVVKSPFLKSQISSSSRIDRTPDVHSANSKDSGSSHGSHTTSSCSSETNSTENSGSSLPDSAQVSFRNISNTSLGSAKEGSNPSAISLMSSGLGTTFIEPEMTEQRRLLLASQPIYEEIPNGGNEDIDDYEDDNVNISKESNGLMLDSKEDVSSKSTVNTENASSLKRVLLPGEAAKSQISHKWLHQSHTVGPPPQAAAAPVSSTLLPSASASAPPVGASPSSPSHAMSKQNSASLSLSSSLSMSSSQIMSSSLMTTSITSSMLPPPPPPPDHIPVPPSSASRSISRETVSSECDTQSDCSNDTHSNCSTLSRPRPVPRRKPKRPDTGGCDQYVSMNRPNAQVSLSEDKLKDVFTKLTSITFHALQDIYAQCEKILAVDRLDVPNSKMLKWADFDIYGQPLHASGRCVVYNAKLRANNCPCQVMILHSRPATEMFTTSHPSLLRPSAVFADTIPFSFLTPDFIKTSQLLQNSVYDSSQARCFIAIGTFDIVESLDSHLALLRETMAQDLSSYLTILLTAALQLLSAMSHCLDQGFSVTETDYNDVFLITRADLRGKVVAFLPRQRSLDVPQGEAMCNFLDRLLTDNMPDDADDDDIDQDEDDYEEEEDGEKIISAPKKVVLKLRSMLFPRRVECMGQVRTAVEYLLWGPAQSELPLSPAGVEPKPSRKASAGAGIGASREQELYVWLEKERVSTVGRLARNVPGLGAGLSLEEFYTLKFLLKTSAGCLAESLRRLSR